MFIHIGGDTMVRLKDIIGIFDIQAQQSHHSANFFDFAQKNDAIEVVEVGDIKSFIVTERKLYYSPISSLTLKKRAQFTDSTEKLDVELRN